MSQLNVFRDYFNERLTTAALEIFAAAEKLFTEFEEEISRSKEESTRLQRLLDIVTQPEIKLHRTDVQRLSLPEPQQIKEEQELWTSQEEEQLQGLQSETTDSVFTSTSVKHDWDQEGSSECSHLDQTVKVENREGDSLPSNTTDEQIKAEPDGQDCTAPEPGSDSQTLSVEAPDCPTAQSLEEEEHRVQLFLNRTQDSEAPPREHMPQRRHRGKTKHQCQECNKTFCGKGALVFHMRKHTEDKSYHCQQCNKPFSEKGNLVKHMKTHTGERPFQCQECSKLFARRDTLREHMRTHTSEKPYKCQQCNKSFCRPYGLVIHMRGHTGEKPFQCQQCNKTYSEKSALFFHMRIHTGEKPYQCQQCNKRFPRKGNLAIHMRTHTGEKPYQCQQCNKKFSMNSSLVVHMRTHTGEKPYQCQQCNKLFSMKCNLVVHMRIHTGEKPYQCQKCSKHFSKSSSLYAHMRTHVFRSDLPPLSCH
ncbi:zinc finger protein OZF-like [Hypomesus transpacificus]|uniref:zinc finger protein OZF-like n=1 Tax=Hypomesus transpacificus TaxID=137520 RepID=UPI001F087DFA|nr:zinc finger protein OZF-like [Hypomesus transpacificus]